MCKRLMGNLNLLGSVRKVYSHPEAFNYHQTTKHKTQSSLPDVIKGTWFCLSNRFFKVCPDRMLLEFPLKSTSEVPKKVQKSLTEVVTKGEKKVKEKFESKLHESFPSYRMSSLESVLKQQT